MSNINWNNLRSWNCSQQSAFEELCCQLASYEQTPIGSAFVRKGAPDAGVECFWSLSNLDELAWQAKFFFSVDESQWKQLDESVRTALNKHPHLISYTVCLPIDRQDPRIDQQKWFMDKWNERVEKWQGWAQSVGMSVDFNYWGEHEIIKRLTREEHQGRYRFWFNAELFSQDWFKSRLHEAIANAGARYSPELNVELPVARLFDGLGRTEEFFNRLKTLREKIRKVSASAINLKKNLSAKAIFESLQEGMDQLLSILNGLDATSMAEIDFTATSKLASECSNKAYEYIRVLREIEEEEKRKGGSEQDLQRLGGRSSRNSGYQTYNELRQELQRFSVG
jgi:hypothetical protein